MTATINAATLRDRLDRKIADLLATAGELRAIMDEATSHSDADLAIRQSHPCRMCDGEGGLSTIPDRGIPYWSKCQFCDGTGIDGPTLDCITKRCPACQGNGVRLRETVEEDNGTTYYVQHYDGPCPDCKGTGYATRCPSCGGATGSYDTHGQWYDCGPCGAKGYATAVAAALER